ncbi:sensor domain-containing diguanylate cyclase [Vibrio viridaestus]|uniref:diguanylate cyclase n=1 Tax=Vibrio viridaestus TaxID=2487322 RepID=A0A3N9TZ32_9VIBR|nr:diguanylate cyclase [Vibrio viridaestus]RQW62212.1 diguanylate cyclase [Vibrio viridaestus]
MIKQQFISVNAVMRLVTTMIVIMVLLVYAITGIFIYIIEKDELQDLYTRINLALNVEANHDLEIVTEYSFWDESYQNIVVKKNNKWIQDNIEHYVLTKYQFDFAAFQSADEQTHIIAQQHHDKISSQDLTDASLPNSNLMGVEGASLFVNLGGAIYQIVTVPFVSEETEQKRAESLLIGFRITQNYLDKLVANYELPNISISHNLDASNRVVLKDFVGNVQGILTWKHISATRALIPYMLIAGIILLLGSIYVTRRVLYAELGVRVHYEQRLYQAATKDDLTGISNRKFFIDYAEREFNFLRLEGRHYSLLMLDIDYFKKINDTYGHAAGDSALNHFAEVCKNALRERDLFGRIGGEEFAIFLPDTDQDNAFAVAERIHAQLREHPITDIGIKHVKVSVSIGLAGHLLNAISFDELLKYADEALYQAKSEGRNRTIIAINTTHS